MHQDTQIYRDIGHLLTMSQVQSSRFDKVETDLADVRQDVKTINVTLTKVTAIWIIIKRAILGGGLLVTGVMAGLNSKELATIAFDVLRRVLTSG